MIIDLSKIQKMLRGYFEFENQRDWLGQVKNSTITNLEMLSAQIQLGYLSLNAISDLVSMAHPDTEDHLGHEKYKQHLNGIDDTLELIYLAYLRQILSEFQWDVEKTIQHCMLMFTEMDTRIVKTKEEALSIFRNACSSHLACNPDCLSDFMDALFAIQSTFVGSKCFDWICGIDLLEKYHWLTEHPLNDQNQKHQLEVVIPVIKMIGNDQMMQEAQNSTKH